MLGEGELVPLGGGGWREGGRGYLRELLAAGVLLLEKLGDVWDRGRGELGPNAQGEVMEGKGCV